MILHRRGMAVGEIAEELGVPADEVRAEIVEQWRRGRDLGKADPLASKPGRKGKE